MPVQALRLPMIVSRSTILRETVSARSGSRRRSRCAVVARHAGGCENGGADRTSRSPAGPPTRSDHRARARREAETASDANDPISRTRCRSPRRAARTCGCAWPRTHALAGGHRFWPRPWTRSTRIDSQVRAITPVCPTPAASVGHSASALPAAPSHTCLVPTPSGVPSCAHADVGTDRLLRALERGRAPRRPRRRSRADDGGAL